MAKGASKAVETDKPARERVTLTKEQRTTIFRTAGGRCFVFGTELEPLGTWHVEDGVLLSPEAKKMKASRSLEELRAWVSEKRAQVATELGDAESALAEARARRDQVEHLLGPLVVAGVVVFAGERGE